MTEPMEAARRILDTPYEGGGLDVNDVVAVARALLAREQAVAGWQPIETAPRDGTAILGWRRKGGMRIAQWNGMEWRSIPTGYTLDMTHWQPLPAPPGQEQP